MLCRILTSRTRAKQLSIYDFNDEDCLLKPNCSFAKCLAGYRGIFNESKSSTWANVSGNVPSASFADQDMDNLDVYYGTGALHTKQTAMLTDYPFVIDSGDTQYQNLNDLDLGRNYSLLDSLFSIGENFRLCLRGIRVLQAAMKAMAVLPLANKPRG